MNTATEKMVANFRANLLGQINKHKAESERLQDWIDTLDKEGFDWDNVTETQAHFILTIKCYHDETILDEYQIKGREL